MEPEIQDGDRVTLVMFGVVRKGVAHATESPDVFRVVMDEGEDVFPRTVLTLLEDDQAPASD